MQFGLIVSVVLHAALLGWAFITIHTQRDMRALEPEPIVTAIISESDLTRLKQGVRTAKQLEAMAKEMPKPDVAKKETAKPKPVAAPPPPPPPEPKSDPIAEKLAAAEPPPPPVDEQKQREAAALKEAARQAEEKRRADEQQRVAAEAQRLAEEQKRAEEERKAQEQKRAEEQRRVEEERRQAELKRKADEERKQRQAAAKKKREEEAKRRQAEAKRKQEEERRRQEAEAKKAKEKFDPDAIEKQLALLDRDPRKKNAAAATPPPENETKQKGPTLGAPEGRDQKISASEIAMIAQVIRSCVAAKWNVLSGGVSARETLVRIRLQFNPDGTLNKAPEIMNPQGSSYFLAISESAVRAVQDCEPFNLPAPRYEVWRDIVINFQPKDMY